MTNNSNDRSLKFWLKLKTGAKADPTLGLILTPKCPSAWKNPLQKARKSQRLKRLGKAKLAIAASNIAVA